MFFWNMAGPGNYESDKVLPKGNKYWEGPKPSIPKASVSMLDQMQRGKKELPGPGQYNP